VRIGPAKPLRHLGALVTQHYRAAFAVVGIALVSYLLWTVGTDAVMASFRVLSWRGLLVVLFPAALLKLTDARGWSALVAPRQIPLRRLLRALVAGQAVAALNPTGPFGGDAVKVLMIRQDLSRRDAVASLIVAQTTSTASQGVFLFIGLVLASQLSPGAGALVRVMWWLVLLEALAIAAFVFLQLQGIAARTARILRRLGLSGSYLPAALYVDDSLGGFYRRGRLRLVWSFVWHLIGWCLGA